MDDFDEEQTDATISLSPTQPTLSVSNEPPPSPPPPAFDATVAVAAAAAADAATDATVDDPPHSSHSELTNPYDGSVTVPLELLPRRILPPRGDDDDGDDGDDGDGSSYCLGGADCVAYAG